MFLQYITLSCMVLMLGCFIYISLAYPFWKSQPVVHPYSIFRHFISTIKTIQQPQKANNNKYYDHRAITCMWQDSPFHHEIATFIQRNIKHVCVTDNVLCTVHENVLNTYSSSSPNDAIVTIQYQYDDNSSSKSSLKGVVYSRPITMTFEKNTSRIANSMYIEYACVHNTDRNRLRTWQTLLYTHLQNQARLCEDGYSIPPISILKSSAMEDQRGIVPIVRYNSYLFRMVDIVPRRVVALPPHILCTPCTIDDCHQFETFVNKAFDIVVLPPSLATLLTSKEIHVYTLRLKNSILAFYVFKNLHLHYEHVAEGNTLELVASVDLQKGKHLGTFVQGFYAAIQNIVKTTAYVCLEIDALSHNDHIVNNITKGQTPLQTFRHAIYTVGLSFPDTFQSNRVCCVL